MKPPQSSKFMISSETSRRLPTNRVSTASRRRVQTLNALLALLALLPIGLLWYGLRQDQNATRMVVDANRSGSLRYKSLWIHAMTNPETGARVLVQKSSGNLGSWQAVWSDMTAIRKTLRADYPGPVATTDAAWAAFDGSLQRFGKVDWQTAESLRIAADKQTQSIVAQALRQRNDSDTVLVLGMLSVLVSVLVGLSLLRKLRHAETRLSHEHAFMEAVLQTAGALVVVVDPDGHIVRFNRACEQLTGYTESEAVGKIPWEFLIPLDEVGGVLGVFGQLRSGQYPNRFENQWLTRSGGRRRIAWTNTALTNAEGVVDFVIGTGIDITERHDAEQRLSEANVRLETLSLQDGLTGLGNRRALDARLASACEEAARYGHPLSLLLLDVDHFKRFNDVHGHLAGDDVLKGVADFLQQAVRASDFVARYGGEEFVVVLPQTQSADALALAQRICQEMEAAALSPLRAVTTSIGVATWTAVMDCPDDLLAAADHALYFGKKRRNIAVHIDTVIEMAGEIPDDNHEVIQK